MKTNNFILIVAALALLFGSCLISGCGHAEMVASGGNDTSFIQKALDKTLPADFTGRFEGGHKNVYFDFEIVADGLKRAERGWTWTYLKYRRSGRFSNGWITLGTPPPSPTPVAN